MNTEIGLVINQFQQAYEGDPWFGRSVKSLLDDVDETTAFHQPFGQHSILQLVWHVVNWRAFVVNSFQPEKPASYYDEMDWQELDSTDKTLWAKGLQQLAETQRQLITLLREVEDAFLDNTVPGREYNFRHLLHGLIQHDVYHAGQIAYLTKLLRSNTDSAK